MHMSWSTFLLSLFVVFTASDISESRTDRDVSSGMLFCIRSSDSILRKGPRTRDRIPSDRVNQSHDGMSRHMGRAARTLP